MSSRRIQIPPGRRLLLAVIVSIVVVLLIGTLIVPGPRAKPGASPAPVVGHPAPNFSLSALRGPAIALNSLRGNVVLLNFWATWCVPCRTEVPRLVSWYQHFHRNRLIVVGIDRQEPQSDVQGFAARYHMTYPIGIDSSGSILAQYRVVPLPASFVLDASGVVRSVRYGALDDAYFTSAILPLLSR